jgi:hypothetical protein
MFIERYLRSPRRGSEGRNETTLVLVKLSSAPRTAPEGLGPLSYKHVTPYRGETRRFITNERR